MMYKIVKKKRFVRFNYILYNMTPNSRVPVFFSVQFLLNMIQPNHSHSMLKMCVSADTLRFFAQHTRYV